MLLREERRVAPQRLGIRFCMCVGLRGLLADAERDLLAERIAFLLEPIRVDEPAPTIIRVLADRGCASAPAR